MANAPITGEYPSERNTPALTLPFSQSAVGSPITKANLADAKHPINIANISGKTRGATILLDDDTVYWATGHTASAPWQALGSGGGSVGGDGIKTINGEGPDAQGNIILPLASLKSKYAPGTAYTLVREDADMVIVCNAASFKLTLPNLAANPDGNVYCCLIVNSAGSIEIESDEPVVSYALYADKGVTLGLMWTGLEWVATGTNVPEEET